MANQQTSFTTPNYDYGADISQIERRRALAQVMQQQSMAPAEVPQAGPGQFQARISPFQGAAKLAEAFASKRQSDKADTQQRELARKSQEDYRQMLVKGMGQLRGTPATAASEDASGNVSAAQPAVAPDPMGAMATLGSHPMGAQFMPLAMQQMQRQQWIDSMSPQGGQPQPSPMNPQGPNPSIMAGSGPNPTLPQGVAPNQSPGGVGGPAAGIPMQQWLAAPPEAKAYLEALSKERAPINVREGGAVYVPGQNAPMFQNFKTTPGQQIDYSGGKPVMSNIPGAIPSMASLAESQAQATERGKFPFQNVTQASGGIVPAFTVPGLTSQMPGGANSGPTPVAGPRPIPVTSPSQQQRPMATQSDPWTTMPKRIEPQGIGESSYHKASSGQQAEAAAKISEKYGAVAQTANERKSFNDQALQMLPQATTGPGALSITGMQSFLNSRFNIPLDQLQKATAGDAAATQELNKNLLNAATKTAKANYGSRMTQSEVMMQIKQGSPNVDMTRGAINYLLNADNARANYEIKQGQDVGKYLQQGGDPYQFEGWYSRSFPMSGAIHAAPQNSVKQVVNSGGNLNPQEQAELDQLRARFGGR